MWKAKLMMILLTIGATGYASEALGFLTYIYNSPDTVSKNNKVQIFSPDKNIEASFFFNRDSIGKLFIQYNLKYKSVPVVLNSGTDLVLDDHLSEQALALKVPKHERWFENLVITGVTRTDKDTIWKPLYGERSRIVDKYNQMIIHLQKDDYPNYKLDLEVRAYDEGLAFRYYFVENPTGVYYHILSENTEFTMPEGTKAWFTSWAQGPYQLLPLSNWPDESERPLTLELKNGLKVCLLEGNLSDYPRTKFKLSKIKENTILTSMYSGTDKVSPFYTPWRGIMVAEKFGQLIENDDFILDLNDPCKVENTDWIKPGKIIREMTLTTEGAMSCIDFAARHHLQYILFDARWYGPAMTFSSDATQVVAPIDMKKVVDYGVQRHVAVWLYVNQQALQKQADQLFPVYKSWGIKGVKFGFVEVGAQRWTVWLEDLVRKAAVNQLMVNIHDEYRPTGTQRTWPNVLTQEGIRGNEEMPDATHNTILPFTRLIAGAADYTVCYYSKRIKTTHAHQLALSVIMYSPLQTLYWYDKPSDSKDEPELEFFDKVPTTWDETRVLAGEPGQFIVTARRKGEEWFIGAITNDNANNITIPLSFLQKGKEYLASVYSDDTSVATATKVKIERLKTNASKELKLQLTASGGEAIWLKPENLK
ncbi:MAG TPA: glycoside hydrolase family 97 catalytic domain-containing protein [Bacteroidales bacterium]